MAYIQCSSCCAAHQVLREDVEAALAEASLAQERAALLGLEREELQRQRDQLAGTQNDSVTTTAAAKDSS